MKRTGFTLTELLVVIAVTAMLIGILLPVLRSTRQQAKVAACGSNLKQLSLALTVYEQESGTFPYGFDDHLMVAPPGGYPGDASLDLQGWWWFHSLSGIRGQNYGKGTILWCPSRSVRNPYVLCGNYGVNRAICKDTAGFADSEFIGRPLGLNQIRHPARTLLITDSGYSLISWRGATNEPNQPFENTRREGNFYVPGLVVNEKRVLDGTISPGCERDAVDGRHPKRSVNVGFADGHIARVKADDLFVEENDGSYSNLSPLWLPK